MATPPSGGQEKAKQRIRVLDLIQRHAGSNAREGQKTKWIVDLVIKVDEQYRTEITQQQEQIVELQQQLQDLRMQSSSTITQLEGQVQSLTSLVRDHEVSLASASYALQTAQVQHGHMQESLRCAEDAAALAAGECSGLVQAVQLLCDQEARVRSGQANKVHQLREALQQTGAALRQAAQADRSAQNEREWKLREREHALGAARGALLEQQAIHQARDTALESVQLKYHLSVQKIKELLHNASQQGGSAAAAIASGTQASSAPSQQHTSGGGGNRAAATTAQG